VTLIYNSIAIASHIDVGSSLAKKEILHVFKFIYRCGTLISTSTLDFRTWACLLFPRNGFFNLLTCVFQNYGKNDSFVSSTIEYRVNPWKNIKMDYR
jgi:hypothetical protein